LILLREKVRNKIKDTFTTKTIPYDQLTYGELVSFTQKEGLKICQDLKLQKHLKWEIKCTRQELGRFYHQFEISTKNPPAVKTVQNSKAIRAKNLLTNDQPINTKNSFTTNQNKPTTKSPTKNLPNPINLSSQNPNQNLTSKTLPVTNVTRKDIHPVSAKSVLNYMSFK